MKKYKAKITKENFKAFADYYNADKQRVEDMLEQVYEFFYRHNDPVYEKAKEMFGAKWLSDSDKKYTFRLDSDENQQLQVLVDYVADHNLTWNVVEMQGSFLYLRFSGNFMFWTKEFCELIELPDYEAMSMAEVRGQIGTDAVGSFLPAEMNALSIDRVNEEKDDLLSKEKELKKLKDDISYAKTEELAKMEEEINKLQDKLRERKRELLAELAEKTAALRAEMDKLNNKIYMMESEIYVIRSYTGETVELNKVRNGKKADADTPLVVNQKLIYLDEDLARIVSIYKDEIANQYSLFSDAVAASDEVFESFCPQERCLTFFRLSNSATYRWFNADHCMYETEELIHGKKMGFILRDGECAYVGYLDESWRTDENGDSVPVTFTGNLMYKPGEKQEFQVKEDDRDKETCDSRNTMLSRVFAMSVVQGILDNRGLLEFTEKVSVTKPGKYIVYNYADGWITDDRFGDFATLVDNLNKRTKVKDTILVCYNKRYCEGRGDVDRAHDCEVPEGLNRVNLIEADEYGHCSVYVSAKKRWSACGATANVLCRMNEYINITYMNSIWLTYYVQTKKMGSYCEDYAKMIKHFKRAIEIIREREAEEMLYIKKYYPQADQIPEWQVLLSHWKLNNHIRFINDFQAKRIAKYLEAGKYEENAHLFERETFYRDEDATAYGKYGYTNFTYISKGWGEKPSPDGFGENSTYYYENFYLNDYDTTVYYWDKDIKKQNENNAVVIARDLPKLEALVPERIKKDEKKLALVNDFVMGFMAEHGVSVSDLTEESEQTVLIFNREKNNIAFKPVDELTSEERALFFDKAAGDYPRYILQSECWKVAYNDFVQRQYDVVLHDIKMILHRRHMDERRR